MNITYSAPSYIILSGKYSGIYSKPVLIVATENRTVFTINEGKKNRHDKLVNDIDHQVRLYLAKKQILFRERPFTYNITYNTYFNSAESLLTTAVAALLEFYTAQEFAITEVNNLANAINKRFNTSTQGFETSVCCYGGLIFFRKEFEFLKNISQLNFKIPSMFEKHLFLPNQQQKDQPEEYIHKLYSKNPQEAEQLVQKLEKNTKLMVLSIAKEDVVLFKQCLETEKQLLYYSPTLLSVQFHQATKGLSREKFTDSK